MHLRRNHSTRDHLNRERVVMARTEGRERNEKSIERLWRLRQRCHARNEYRPKKQRRQLHKDTNSPSLKCISCRRSNPCRSRSTDNISAETQRRTRNVDISRSPLKYLSGQCLSVHGHDRTGFKRTLTALRGGRSRGVLGRSKVGPTRNFFCFPFSKLPCSMTNFHCEIRAPCILLPPPCCLLSSSASLHHALPGFLKPFSKGNLCIPLCVLIKMSSWEDGRRRKAWGR